MGAVENMKEVAELVKKYNDIELNRRILNLENEVLDLSREKRRAEEKIEDLERTLKFAKDLSLRQGFYWLEGDANPFCLGCWDAKRMAIHVKRLAFVKDGNRYECPHCRTLYKPPTGQA
jgi:hypothetical protein